MTLGNHDEVTRLLSFEDYIQSWIRFQKDGTVKITLQTANKTYKRYIIDDCRLGEGYLRLVEKKVRKWY